MNEEKKDKLNILVVDDDALNQQMMRLLLEQWGHKVSIAGNGVQAVDRMGTDRFDVVFMDLQMPEMGGLEASRKIRERENGDRSTFIVALTASYLPEYGQKLFEAGIDNYIAKPFDVEQIERILGYRTASNREVNKAVRPRAAEEIEVSGVLDIQRGMERVGSSPETYWSLLNDFVDELPGRVKILQNALALRDLETLSRAAHNLKGVSANLGALQLSEYADRLDRVSEAGYTEETEKLVDEVKSAGVAVQRVAGMLLTGRS